MVRGVLFDKDGTLFDFQKSWSGWAEDVLIDLSDGSPDTLRALAALISYDIDKKSFSPDSLAIAGTLSEVAEALALGLPGCDPVVLEDRLGRAAERVVMVPAAPLVPLFEGLKGRGHILGVATNDAERAARIQLEVAGIIDILHFISGYDSGHGGKPDPGMCLAFAQAAGLAPEACVMVGDSTHDLVAGRAAGMRTVAVLTGVATARDLAPLADAVLPDIGALPDWLAAQG
jgi:phosphoglycolate phosphatase